MYSIEIILSQHVPSHNSFQKKKKNIVHSMFLLVSAFFWFFKNVYIFLRFCFVLIGNFCLKLYNSGKHILEQLFSFHLVKTELKYLCSFHLIAILVKLSKKGHLWQKSWKKTADVNNISVLKICLKRWKFNFLTSKLCSIWVKTKKSWYQS